MKAIRVSKLRTCLDGLHPNDKVYFSTTEPVVDLSKVCTADLDAELRKRQRALAEHAFQVCVYELGELGFSIGEFILD